MIKRMKVYNIPPQYDFVTYAPKSGEFPFVMYIFEFHHTFDKQDLSDIWQGVAPKISTRAERDEAEISHELNKIEFFESKNLPENIRWLTFKVKKQAEKNYYAITADSADDGRFKFDFDVGKKAPEYSYNWPYDFCSLVEKINIEGGIEILPPAEDLVSDPTLRRIEDTESSLVAVQTRSSVVSRELSESPTAARVTSRTGQVFGEED